MGDFLFAAGIIVMALLGMFNVHRHGAINSAAIVLYALTSCVSGYVSCCFYTQLNGQRWVWNIILTSSLFSGEIMSLYPWMVPARLVHVTCVSLVLRSHSPSVPHVERGELGPLVERLHSGSPSHHCVPAARGLGAGGLPPHRHWRHRWEEPSRQLPSALPHSKHPSADPCTALVQAGRCPHGHRRLPAFQVS